MNFAGSKQLFKRSAKQSFSLQLFLKDYPIVPVVVVVFLIGVGTGYVLGQRKGLGYHFSKDVFSSGALKREAMTSPALQLVKSEAVAVAAVPATLPQKFEVKPEVKQEGFSIKKLFSPKPNPERSRKPRIVFVIDDIGYNNRQADLLFSMKRPVTFSILPRLAYSKYFAEEAKKRGFETILHLPLEPEDAEQDPGAGKITVDMNPSEVKAILDEDLASVPGITGVSNHMGSRATRDRGLMYFVLKELKPKQLFFLDSMTHSKSTAHKVAHAMGVPAVKRDVFLDNVDDFDYITERIEEAAQIAKREGHAVAIGHVRENTLLAIKKAIPHLEEEGLELVTLKDLL